MSRGNKTVVFTLCHSFVNGKRWILLKLKLPEEYHTTKILPKHCAYVVHIQMPKVMMENSVPLRTLFMSCSRHGNATPIFISLRPSVDDKFKSWKSTPFIKVSSIQQAVDHQIMIFRVRSYRTKDESLR